MFLLILLDEEYEDTVVIYVLFIAFGLYFVRFEEEFKLLDVFENIF
jgi:hypothetical protein